VPHRGRGDERALREADAALSSFAVRRPPATGGQRAVRLGSAALPRPVLHVRRIDGAQSVRRHAWEELRNRDRRSHFLAGPPGREGGLRAGRPGGTPLPGRRVPDGGRFASSAGERGPASCHVAVLKTRRSSTVQRGPMTRRFLLPCFCALAGCLSGQPIEGLAPARDTGGPRIVYDPTRKPLPEIPFPNDLGTRPDLGSPTGLRLNSSLVAPS